MCMGNACATGRTMTLLTGYTGVVDLHVDGVSTTTHQVRVADMDRAVIASTALNAGRQVSQLDTVTSRWTISTRRVWRRHAVEDLDDSDQLRTAVRSRRTPQSKCRYSWHAETLTADVNDRWTGIRWRQRYVIDYKEQHKHAPAFLRFYLHYWYTHVIQLKFAMRLPLFSHCIVASHVFCIVAYIFHFKDVDRNCFFLFLVKTFVRPIPVPYTCTLVLQNCFLVAMWQSVFMTQANTW